MNRHRWTCYVEAQWAPPTGDVQDATLARVQAITLLRGVTFDLHPTFNPPRVTVLRACETDGRLRFSVRRVGWGAFEIDICVWLVGQSAPLRLSHMLRFGANGDYWTHYSVRVPSSLVTSALHSALHRVTERAGVYP